MFNFTFDFKLRLKKYGRENPRKYTNGIFGCISHGARAWGEVREFGVEEFGVRE